MKPEQLTGTHIGRYHLGALIGTGGVAAVYEATDSVTERRLALKVLFPPPGAGPELGERFRREARTVARLDHPGILPVFDVGEADGHLFIAMKRAEGPSLQALLEARGRFDEATAAEVAAQVAEALDYAHRQGVIHRDVKPSNILMDGGRPVLTDFGVARALDDPALTATGLTVGTPAYMSPEQASDRADLDGRADLYCVGRGAVSDGHRAHALLGQHAAGDARSRLRAAAHAFVHRRRIAGHGGGDSARPGQRPRRPPSHRRSAGRRPADAGHADAHPPAHFASGQAVPPGRVRAVRWGVGALLAAGLLGGGLWLAAGGSPLAAPTPSPTRSVAIAGPTPQNVAGRPASATPSPTLASSPSPTPAPPSATPTLTLTPSPVATPTLAPTASPTRPPKPPTSTPLPPSPTPCPQPAAAAFAAWPTSRAGLAAQVGCPRGQALQIAAAWEPFERGGMLWRGDLHQIYVLRQAGTWAVYDDLVARWGHGVGRHHRAAGRLHAAGARLRPGMARAGGRARRPGLGDCLRSHLRRRFSTVSARASHRRRGAGPAMGASQRRDVAGRAINERGEQWVRPAISYLSIVAKLEDHASLPEDDDVWPGVWARSRRCKCSTAWSS